jgi:hypothetical protein
MSLLANSSWRKENWGREEIEVGDEERGRIDSEVTEFIHCLNLSNFAHPLLYNTCTQIRLHGSIPLWVGMCTLGTKGRDERRSPITCRSC